MAKPQKKVSIDLNIKSVRIQNLQETLKVQIIWKRGKSIYSNPTRCEKHRHQGADHRTG